MGENVSTEENNRTDTYTLTYLPLASLSHMYYERSRPLLAKLGSRVDDILTPPTEDAVKGIMTGLDAFRSNLALFFRASAYQVPLKRHLAFTIMVPGGRAVRAHTALGILSKANPYYTYTDPAELAELIKPYVRFHNQKAERLIGALGKWDELCAVVTGTADDNLRGVDPRDRLAEIRAWIIANIPGMSNKASAHFMRNVGLFDIASGFPIIDVHIYKVLEAFKFHHRYAYADAEPAFTALADLVTIPVIPLDAILWCAFSGSWDPNELDFGNFEEEEEVEQEE